MVGNPPTMVAKGGALKYQHFSINGDGGGKVSGNVEA